jgi:hypothetical protein
MYKAERVTRAPLLEAAVCRCVALQTRCSRFFDWPALSPQTTSSPFPLFIHRLSNLQTPDRSLSQAGSLLNITVVFTSVERRLINLEERTTQFTRTKPETSFHKLLLTPRTSEAPTAHHQGPRPSGSPHTYPPFEGQATIFYFRFCVCIRYTSSETKMIRSTQIARLDGRTAKDATLGM